MSLIKGWDGVKACPILQEFDVQEIATEKDKKVDRKSCLGVEGFVGQTWLGIVFCGHGASQCRMAMFPGVVSMFAIFYMRFGSFDCSTPSFAWSVAVKSILL